MNIKQHWLKLLICLLLLIAGVWGLTAVRTEFIEATKVYSSELAPFTITARIILCFFAGLLVYAGLAIYRHIFKPGDGSTMTLAAYTTLCAIIGLAIGFAFAGILVSKGPFLDPVMAICSPSMFLLFGWTMLGFPPHGDAGWNLYPWAVVLQWLLIGIAIGWVRRIILNKKAQQGGPGYPPQSVGSPDP